MRKLIGWILAAVGMAAPLGSNAALSQSTVVTGAPIIATGELTITPLNHATFALQRGKTVVYVDPVGGAARFAGLPRPGLILITDIHGDHLDVATVRDVRTEQTVIVAPEAARQQLKDGGVPLASVRFLANGKTVELADLGSAVSVAAIPMYNLTPERLKFHEKGRGNGYVLELAGTRIYISGDTEDIPEMRRLARIDIAFICMNLPYTMTVEQAASAVLEMQPKIVYPYHYRGQDPQRFKALVEAKSKTIEVRLRDWYAAP